MTFANKITRVAEKEAHHPGFKDCAWEKYTIEIWTYKIEDLTESDFILATKIKALYEKR